MNAETMKELPVLFNRKEECCGCTACCSICPRNAISMVMDEEGFEYPQVNGETCIRCYLCLKVCPLRTIKGGCAAENSEKE